MSRPYKCIWCGSYKTVSKGYRKTKTMGKRKLRKCKDCGRKFTPQNQFFVPNETLESTENTPPEPDMKHQDDRYYNTGQ
jgi:transcriptional regulator NrdR family protein